MHARIKLFVAVAAALVVGAAVIPANAHYPSDDAKHAWGHLARQAKKVFYTKGQSNARFLPGANLPVKKTMTGDWGINSQFNTHAWYVTSFPQRLPAMVVANYVPDVSPLGGNPNCPGTLANPKARPGHLCVYEGFDQNARVDNPPLEPRFCFFRGSNTDTSCHATVGRSGFGIVIFPADANAQLGINGTWAVTAAKKTPPVPTALRKVARVQRI